MFVEYNCARSIKIWWMEMYRFTWLVVSSSLNQISHFLVICIIYCSRDLDRSCSATKKKNKFSVDQLTLIFYFLCVIHLHSQFFHWWKLVELFPKKITNYNWGGSFLYVRTPSYHIHLLIIFCADKINIKFCAIIK